MHLLCRDRSFLCDQVNFQDVMKMKYCCPFMIIVSHYMEHDGVKMLKISLALNFFGKIFGNKLKIN